MLPDSSQQRLALNAIRAAGAAGSTPGLFGDAVLVAVGAVVPNDGSHLWLVDPATRLLSRLIASTEADAGNRVVWLRDHYLTELDDLIPYFSTRKMMIAGSSGFAVGADQRTMLGVPEPVRNLVDERQHVQHFAAGGSPVGGFAHVPLTSGAATVGLLTLVFRGGTPFVSRDKFAFLTRHRGTIGRLLAATVAREAAAGATALGEAVASGIVILGPDGRLRFTTPAGERWLETLSAAEPNGGALPTSILAAAAALRSPGSSGATPDVATIATRIGQDQFRVEATRADGEGGIAIVVNPITEVTAPEIPDDWPLTQGERRVAEQVMLGKSNQQISTSLYISESTVETHLRHIFAKLGIKRRTELVGLIYRATMHPNR